MSVISEIITNPKRYFDQIRSSQPSVKVPAVIVLLAGIISAMSGYLMGEMSGKLFVSMGSGIGMIAGISAAVASFFTPFIIWLVISLVFLILVKLLGGSGSFKAYLELVGYGMIPSLISGIITLLLSLYYIPQIVIHPVRSTDATQIQEAVTKMMHDPALIQFSLISTIVMIIFLVWSANIWSFGVEARSNLPSRKALIVVALPVGVYILYSLYTVLTLGGVV